MANALNVLNEDEKKYFESRGEHEPNGYSEASGESEESEEESGLEAASDGANGAISAGDGGQETSGYETDTRENDEYQQEHRPKQSKRDFSKAYGIAESKRQELKAQLEQQAYQNQLLQQQLQMLMQQTQRQQEPVTQKQPAMDIPDPNEDPLGYQAYRLESLNKTVLAQQQYLEQQAKAYQQQQAEAQLDNAYRNAAMEFAKEAPDFMEAYKFLEQSRIQEYMAMGYSPQEASRFLQEDERALAAKSFRDRVNPAQRIYAAAKARGFNSPGESKLSNVAQGMQKGKSLPRAGGKNIEKGYDISRIDEMSDAEFDKFFNQVKAESKRNGDYRKDFY